MVGRPWRTSVLDGVEHERDGSRWDRDDELVDLRSFERPPARRLSGGAQGAVREVASGVRLERNSRRLPPRSEVRELSVEVHVTGLHPDERLEEAVLPLEHRQ